MYAEQFNAPSWLEEPSKWLWWAMQSRLAGNLSDSTYNLQQFWIALDAVKKTATDATWPEIMALDSQSHIQAANTTSAIINAIEQDVNNWTFWLGAAGSIQADDAKTAVSRLQDQRASELQKAADLASQAKTAQAQRVASVAAGRISQDEAQRAQESTTLENIIKSNTSFDFSAIPWWAWLVGAVALLAWSGALTGAFRGGSR